LAFSWKEDGSVAGSQDEIEGDGRGNDKGELATKPQGIEDSHKNELATKVTKNLVAHSSS
jgi:hypothetical protein